MERGEVIAMFPVSSALPVKKHSIFVPVAPELFKQQRYDEALRAVCDELSARGVQNFIHWEWDNKNQHRETLVELIGQPGLFLPVIHHTTSSIELREHDLCDTR